MGVSKNNGIPKSSILIGFSIINHPFWDTPIFGNTQMLRQRSQAIRAFCEKAAQPAQSSVQVELLIAIDPNDTPELRLLWTIFFAWAAWTKPVTFHEILIGL